MATPDEIERTRGTLLCIEGTDPNGESPGAERTKMWERVALVAGQHGGSAGEFHSGILRVVFSVPYARVPARDAMRAADAIGAFFDEQDPPYPWRIGLVTAVMEGEGELGEAFARCREMMQRAGARSVVMDDATRAALPSGTAADEHEIIGRDQERASIEEAFEQAIAGSICHRALIVGDPGVGKSTLVKDCVDALEGRTSIARVQCRAWGSSSLAPFSEALNALVPGLSDNTEQALGALVVDDAGVVADQLRRLFGWGGMSATGDVSFWPIRRVLEELALRRPVVLVLEDVQWADDLLLDGIEDLLLRLAAPIVVLCTARPNLLERRPDFGLGTRTSHVLKLSALDRDASVELVESFLGGRADAGAWLDGLLAAAQGNPFFLVEALAFLRESGSIVEGERGWAGGATDELRGSSTIEAILGSRITSLHREEREIAEAGAVWGSDFSVDDLGSLLPTVESGDMLARLARLQGREFVELSIAVPGAFKFRHDFIRDALYEHCPKPRRVTLHRTAGESAITRQLSDAFIGHHLEQAFVISSELEPVTNEWQAVAQEASQRLATAGRAERARGAQPAAIALFRRAARLHTEPDWQSVNTLIDLAESLGQVGATRDAKETTERVVELSSNLDPRTRARVELFRTREMVTLEGSTDPQVESSLRDLIPVFADQDDHTGLTKIYLAIGQLQWNIGLCAATAASLNIALGHCLQMPTQRDLHVLLSGLAAALFWGPTPTSDAIRESHRLLEIASGDPLAGAVLNLRLAGLQSMQENFADARSLARSSFATLEEFGQDLKAAAATQNSALIEIFAGDLEAAHGELRRGYDALGHLGITSYHRTNSSMLGRVLHDLGRSDEGVPFLDEAEEAGADDPSIGTMTWPVRAEIAAADGDEETTRRFIGQARSMAARSDAVIEKAFIEGPAARAFTRLGLNDEADKARQNLAALAQQKEAPALLRLAGASG